jgi:hypothetical protein
MRFGRSIDCANTHFDGIEGPIEESRAKKTCRRRERPARTDPGHSNLT